MVLRAACILGFVVSQFVSRDLIEFDSGVFPRDVGQHRQEPSRAALSLSGSARLFGFASVHAAYTYLDTRVVNDADITQIGLPLVRRPANAGSVSFALAPKRWTFAAGPVR